VQPLTLSAVFFHWTPSSGSHALHPHYCHGPWESGSERQSGLFVATVYPPPTIIFEPSGGRISTELAAREFLQEAEDVNGPYSDHGWGRRLTIVSPDSGRKFLSDSACRREAVATRVNDRRR